MRLLLKIKEVMNVLNFAKGSFTKGSFRLVGNYIQGLISVGKQSIKKIARAFGKNQQTLNYTLNEAKFEKEKLEKRYFKKMRYMFGDAKIYLILDDTLIERDGKMIEKTQSHFDHNSNSYIKGHQFFTAILCTKTLQLPIFPELYHKETDSKIEMAKNLVDKIKDYGIKIHTVLFDSWYSDKDLVKKCRTAGSRVVCAIKSNRNIFIGRSNKSIKLSFIKDRLIFQKRNNLFIDDKNYLVWETKARLEKIPSVKFVISENTKGEKISLISTNQNDSSEELIRTYKIRWKIETFHRDIKQNLGFEDIFLRRESGIVRHSIFVILSYAILSLFMYRGGMDMTIGECCEYLKNKSTKETMRNIVVIENKQTRLREFEEAFIS